MAVMEAATHIHIKGAREHNLKNLELRLPRGKLVVITGPSGSGKSSLVFDTLYAEGYRKYMESLSTEARQVLDQLQAARRRFHPRTFARAGDRAAHRRRLSAQHDRDRDRDRRLRAPAVGLAGEQLCPKDGGRVVRRSLDDNVARVLARMRRASGSCCLRRVMRAKPSVLRDELPRPAPARLPARADRRRDQGARRAATWSPPARGAVVDLVVDRLVAGAGAAQPARRLARAGLARGRQTARSCSPRGAREAPWRELALSQRLACEICGDVFERLTPRHFSFNHHRGRLPGVRRARAAAGFGAELVVPDPGKSVREGAIKPWRIGRKEPHHKAQRDPQAAGGAAALRPRQALAASSPRRRARRCCTGRASGCSLQAPPHARGEGACLSPGVLADSGRELPRDGQRGLPRPADDLHDQRRVPGVPRRPAQPAQRRPSTARPRRGRSRFRGFLAMDVPRPTTSRVDWCRRSAASEALREVVVGIEQRLRFLLETGLGYLTLDRDYATLSGGEAQRVRLATQLGMGLIGVIYVLDEPSIGLHPHDNEQAAIAAARRCATAATPSRGRARRGDDARRRRDHRARPGGGRRGRAGCSSRGRPSAVRSAAGARLADGAVTSPGRCRCTRTRRPRRRTAHWLTVRGARGAQPAGHRRRGFPSGS